MMAQETTISADEAFFAANLVGGNSNASLLHFEHPTASMEPEAPITGEYSSFLMVSILFVVVSFYVGFVRKPSKPFKELPMAEGCHWLLGHMAKFTGDFKKTQVEVFVQNANEYGQIRPVS